MSCKAKIRPFPNGTELQCVLGGKHYQHQGELHDYAFPGSQATITWMDGDRRSFTGEWVECASKGWTLPNGHRGEHAL